MKTIGIIQPNYIPWRGYFDIINRVDTFVFLDDVQYTKQDWRNRNKMRAITGGTPWITVPVRAKSETLIMDVQINYSSDWTQKHLQSMATSYKESPFLRLYFDELSSILLEKPKLLVDLDVRLCEQICTWLGIKTQLVRSSELGASGIKDHKLIEIVKALGGSRYISGPAAKAYIQPELWKSEDIALEYFEYGPYPDYPQIAAPFEPAVSILDLLFMVGPDAPMYIWVN